MVDRIYPQPDGGIWRGANTRFDQPFSDADIRAVLQDIVDAGGTQVRLHIEPTDYLGDNPTHGVSEFLAYMKDRLTKTYIPLHREYGLSMMLGIENMPHEPGACVMVKE